MHCYYFGAFPEKWRQRQRRRRRSLQLDECFGPTAVAVLWWSAMGAAAAAAIRRRSGEVCGCMYIRRAFITRVAAKSTRTGRKHEPPNNPLGIYIRTDTHLRTRITSRVHIIKFIIFYLYATLLYLYGQ